ncbi:MAG TPA: universal stress protein [Methylovirgula sp.]|nr:universal stress protein [Methylovirgula sp.]
MTYATVMVHLELGQSNAHLLNVAGDVAQQFHADVIGIAACQPMQLTFTDGYLPPELIDEDREEIEREFAKAEREFHDALRKRVVGLEWRSRVTFGSLADYIAREARSADLVITGLDKASLLGTSSSVSASELIMCIGRPVLIVPSGPDALKLERVIIGWKDTREARRATFDALPLLKKAAHVSVVEIADEEECGAARARLDDVVGWLARHGVTAQALAFHPAGDDATRLAAIAQEQAADVIVAGAYGHSRVREWILGGVTRDLLLATPRCALMSH